MTGTRDLLETCLEDLAEKKLSSNSLNSGVDMADLRVREFTDAEVDPIRLWTGVGVELATSKRILEVTQSTSQGCSISFGFYQNRSYPPEVAKHQESSLGRAVSRASGEVTW
jgi:hypothetical protein